jgi:hypothetical protein
MPDIFISYATEDRQTAKRLAARLREDGWDVLWDQVIEAGADWDATIQTALQNARCVLVLWSAISRKSFWVRAEAADSCERDAYVPVCIDGAELPRLFRHVQAQSIVFMANSSSRRHRCLIEPTTMLPPTVRSKTRALRFKCFDRRFPLQPRMTAMPVVVVFESDQFGF